MIKKICIDWGNTICPITGEYSGPMIEWPVIDLYDNVKEVLEKLQGNYELLIATNAKESTIDQIHAVMERVHCAHYFSHIFTPAEIGVGKYMVSYYQSVAARMDCLPQDILMIGDDYDLDVRNAWEAGFHTMLFNPMNFAPHGMFLPFHDYEVNSWCEIPKQLSIPRPTLQESLSWLQRENESYVLLQHVQTVAAITYWFAVRLRQNHVMVDAILAHRAACLHDLDKLSPNRPSKEHGRAGAEMLAAMGYPQIAGIVGSHVIATPDQVKFNSLEAELVFFADKLVKHNQIVSVEERFEDLATRYPKNAEFQEVVVPFLQNLQEKLCERINVPSNQLVALIKSDLMGQKPH